MTKSRSEFGFVNDYETGTGTNATSLAAIFKSCNYDRIIRRIEWSFHLVDLADYFNTYPQQVLFCALYIIKGTSVPTYTFNAIQGIFGGAGNPNAEMMYSQVATCPADNSPPIVTSLEYKIPAGDECVVAVSLIEHFTPGGAFQTAKPGARTLNVFGENITDKAMMEQRTNWR